MDFFLGVQLHFTIDQSILSAREKNFKVFLKFVKDLDERFQVSLRHNRHVLVNNLIEGTVSSAIKVLRGEYEDNAITVRTIYRMVFQPVFLALGIDPTTLD